MSWLYKHRSQTIDVFNNQANIIYFYLIFYPNFSSFHRLDLVSVVSTPYVIVVLAYLSVQMSFSQMRSFLIKYRWCP
jgi:hypothetical protein